ARARIILGVGTEQRQLTQCAGVGAGLFVRQERSGEWRFGALVQQNASLICGEFLDSRVPLLVAERGEVVAGGRSSSSHRREDIRVGQVLWQRSGSARGRGRRNQRSVTLRDGELEARIRGR